LTAESTSSPNPSEPTEQNAVPPSEAPGEAAEGKQALSIDSLLDVSMPVIIEIGRTSMALSEIMDLGEGSVVQLDRLVGDPVDIHVGDRKLAEGEVVVIGDNFGVRITRLLADGQEREAA